MSADAPLEPRVEAWLGSVGFGSAEAMALAGDVSPRRYVRLRAADGATAILASYPIELLAVCERFRETTALLASAGVRVPAILAADCTLGSMLLEDLGDQTVAELGLGFPAVRPYFAAALGAAQRIARLPADRVAALNPPLGTELLHRELEQTWERYLVPRGLVADAALAADLRAAFVWLAEGLGRESLVPCHRDFMVRNLMPVECGEVAVLDHQDLRLGPAAYDLASLLNDTLFPPPEDELGWVAEILGEGGQRRYRMAAAQRCLKAVGTYAAFAARGAPRHLPLIAPTLRRALGHLGEIAESAALARALSGAWRQVLH